MLEAGGIERHIQLKSSFEEAKTSRQNINVRLADRPSGCVVWIWFDPTTLEQTSFKWLGVEPGAPLPSLPEKTGKHTKGNADGFKAERSNMRVANKGDFDTVIGFEFLANKLFGARPRRKMMEPIWSKRG